MKRAHVFHTQSSRRLLVIMILGGIIILLRIEFSGRNSFAGQAEKRQDNLPKAIGKQAGEKKLSPSQVEIRGKVVDEQGRPVSGSQVRFANVREGDVEVKTASDGTFRIRPKKSTVQYLDLLASANNGNLQGLYRFRESHNADQEVALVLKPCRTISVLVTDGKGNPVQNAKIECLASYAPVAQLMSDTKGECNLKVPADAKVDWIIALKPGVGFDYFENYQSWPSSHRPSPPESVKLVLDSARKVQVQVIDSGGKPVPSASVVPWTIQMKGKLAYANTGGSFIARNHTDKDGLAEFEWLPEELHRNLPFLIDHADYHCPKSPALRSSDDRLELTAQVFHNAEIRGKVSFPAGKPAGGIHLQVEGRGETNHYFRGHVRTDENGIYRMKVYPMQSYIISVLDENWAAPSQYVIEVNEKEIREDLNLELIKGTLIHGKVTLGPEKKPAVGDTVTLLQKTMEFDPQQGRFIQTPKGGEVVRWSNSDRNGDYRFRVGPGHYKLRLPNTSPNQTWIDIEVADEKEIVHNSHAERRARATLTGNIVDRQNKPVANAVVYGESILAFGHAGFQVLSDTKGSFETERWYDEMIVYAKSSEGNLGGYKVISPDDETVSLQLSPAGAVTGKIVDAEGAPIAGAMVFCRLYPNGMKVKRRGLTFRVTSGKSGRFEIKGLAVNCECELQASFEDNYSQIPPITINSIETVNTKDIVIGESNDK